jgi:tetratricopeptide (TPR) repeat protein
MQPQPKAGKETLSSFRHLVDAVEAQIAGGHYDRAAGLCERELEASPASVSVLELLTSVWERGGRMERAREAAVRWATAAPLDPRAHYRLALIEQRLQSYDWAVYRFRLAIAHAGADHALRVAAQDALHSLDAFQSRQVLAMRDVDPTFRARLLADPERALSERGFALSEEARRALLSGLRRLPRGPRPPRPS